MKKEVSRELTPPPRRVLRAGRKDTLPTPAGADALRTAGVVWRRGPAQKQLRSSRAVPSLRTRIGFLFRAPAIANVA